MDDATALKLLIMKHEQSRKKQSNEMSNSYDPFEDCYTEEEMMSEYRELTVTAKGLAALINEILRLRDGETRRVRDGVDEYGRAKHKMEEVPFEEKFQDMQVRTSGEKFVVKVALFTIDQLNQNKAQNDKAAEWESIS